MHHFVTVKITDNGLEFLENMLVEANSSHAAESIALKGACHGELIKQDEGYSDSETLARLTVKENKELTKEQAGFVEDVMNVSQRLAVKTPTSESEDSCWLVEVIACSDGYERKSLTTVIASNQKEAQHAAMEIECHGELIIEDGQWVDAGTQGRIDTRKTIQIDRATMPIISWIVNGMTAGKEPTVEVVENKVITALANQEIKYELSSFAWLSVLDQCQNNIELAITHINESNNPSVKIEVSEHVTECLTTHESDTQVFY